MSRQEIIAYGKQEFGRYPLITMEPLPETLSDYVKVAVREGTGVRVKNPTKHLVCGKTAKTYMFWDNLMYHYKNLAPLYGKKIEFKEYTCPHDGWLFNYSENLRLHNKVAKFEQAEATLIEKRVNLDNTEWKHPSERNMERYIVQEAEQTVKQTLKKSRFLKKDPVAPRNRKEKEKDELEKEEEEKEKERMRKKYEFPEKVYYEPKHKFDYPYDPDLLKPLPRPKPKNVPEHYGWTHSDDADSWFLEAHTPSLHEPYENFYSDALKKKVICPKLYSLAC